MSKKEEYLLEFKTNAETLISQVSMLQNTVESLFDTMNRRNAAQDFQNQVTQATRTAEQRFSTLRNTVNQAFNAVRSLGNAMQQIGQIGVGRFVSAFESTLVSRFTGLFTSQLDASVTRFDIMKTFPAVMANFGVSANAAGAAIKKMNEAVIGLPTSLSEIVELSQRFVSVMPAMGLKGDDLMDKASDFAIAINNAFLAGGNTAQQAYFAMMQLQDLFTKGELTDREWKSLSTGLQGAGIKIAEKFGYENFLQLAEALNEGNVSLEQFVDGMIELGTNGGILDKMARVYTQRISSVFTNIGNAFQRLIAGNMVEGVDENGEPIYTFSGGILGTLDSLIAKRFADNDEINDLASFLRVNIIPKIDELSEQLSGWIIEHEDEIFGFFDRLINYDWAGLTAKIADFLALKWDVFISLLEKIPPGLLAFSSTLAGPAGQALTTFANLIQPMVMAGLWLGKGGLVEKWTSQILANGAAGGAGGLASSASISIPGSTGAGATALGGLGAMGLLLYTFAEQAVLWGKAMEGNEVYRNITGIGRSQRDMMNQRSTFDSAMLVLDALEKLTSKEIIGDVDEQGIKDFVAYLNEVLPEVDIKWDDIVQKVKINGQYINDSVGYLRTHLEVQKEILDLQDIINKKISTEASLRELVASKQTQTSALESLFEQYGEKYGITSDMSAETIATLPGVPTWVSMQFATAMANLSETDRQLKLIRDDMIALDNLEKMLLPEWKNMVKEYRETYGEIPEEVMDMIREGEVVIPSEIEILATLCQRVIEENSIAEPVEEAVNEIPNIIERSRTNARIKAAELGEDIKGAIVLGASSGLSASLFNSIIDQIASAINSARSSVTSNVGYWANNSDPMRGFGEAFGGRIQRIGGNSGDTVLTWLTPGEYVLRKHAVDKIGLDFLNKLNTFNFSGALDSLTQRVGSGMSPYAFAGATANNTRIYNNNAQANITVNNSSQEFTQRRASKWIRGLN